MKRAKKIVTAYAIQCPYCWTDLPQPDSGSLNWEAAEIRKGEVVTCYACQRASQL
jgi:hypothetical protein